MLRRTFVRRNVVENLKATLLEKRAPVLENMNKLKKEKGDESLSKATVSMAYGGMRGICGLIYEPSLLDAQEGIRFRGLTIEDCRQQLPKAVDGGEPLPEAMLYLLLTGDVPTKETTNALNAEFQRRANAPIMDTVKTALDALPQKMHPMSQYVIGTMALQHDSQFARAYKEGKASKNNYWELALEDSISCIARTPLVAAMVYNRFTTGSSDIPALDSSLDWSANFANQMGFKDKEFWDCMRLYLSIHVDHEGGNVSAHTTTLVGSALSDPYLSYAAGMNGLAGPLHGLANQEVLAFLNDMLKRVDEDGIDKSNDEALEKALTKYTWDLLNAKRVVPGYGHAVLRKTDPRYTCQRDFAATHFPNFELFRIVNTIYKIMPDILTEHGKTANPYPNVDAHSGVLLQYYGLKEQDFYTVLFGVSRQLGVLPALVWDRLTGRPIERPKSITTEALMKKFY